MPQANDLSRCLVTLEQDDTLIAVIELSQASWLVAGIVPAIERRLIPAAGSSDGRSAPHATAVWAGSICQELARPV